MQRPFFMEVIVSMCWTIWTVKNDIILKNLQHLVGPCKVTFRKELALVKLAMS
jgi:hypothetical protein